MKVTVFSLKSGNLWNHKRFVNQCPICNSVSYYSSHNIDKATDHNGFIWKYHLSHDCSAVDSVGTMSAQQCAWDKFATYLHVCDVRLAHFVLMSGTSSFYSHCTQICTIKLNYVELLLHNALIAGVRIGYIIILQQRNLY
jgi:hypothetical protein